jgi:hypothetical protein
LHHAANIASSSTACPFAAGTLHREADRRDRREIATERMCGVVAAPSVRFFFAR